MNGRLAPDSPPASGRLRKNSRAVFFLKFIYLFPDLLWLHLKCLRRNHCVYCCSRTGGSSVSFTNQVFLSAVWKLNHIICLTPPFLPKISRRPKITNVNQQDIEDLDHYEMKEEEPVDGKKSEDDGIEKENLAILEKIRKNQRQDHLNVSCHCVLWGFLRSQLVDVETGFHINMGRAHDPCSFARIAGTVKISETSHINMNAYWDKVFSLMSAHPKHRWQFNAHSEFYYVVLRFYFFFFVFLLLYRELCLVRCKPLTVWWRSSERSTGLRVTRQVWSPHRFALWYKHDST